MPSDFCAAFRLAVRGAARGRAGVWGAATGRAGSRGPTPRRGVLVRADLADRATSRVRFCTRRHVVRGAGYAPTG